MNRAIETPGDHVLAESFARLDPNVVLAACREQLSSVDQTRRAAWRDVRVVEALYHPQRYARVAYAFVTDPATPAQRVWPEGDVVYVHAPVRPPMSRRGTTLHIDGLDLEAYRFPNDRRLRGLRRFAGASDAIRYWQGWIDRKSPSTTIDAASLQRILWRYVPEHKWVIRLRAEVTDSQSNARSKRRIAVRCASPDSCRRLLHRHLAVSSVARDAGDTFHVPPVVGSDIDNGILAVEWNRGDALLDLLQSGSSAELLSEVAKAVAAFHQTTLEDIESTTPKRLMLELRAAGDELSLAHPDLTQRIDDLVRNVETRSSQISCDETATLHNDLHVGQVRIKRGRIAILDLERMVKGDPLIDVANFALQLQMLGHRPEFNVDCATADQWAFEFVDAWARQSGKPIDPIRFSCYAVRSLISLAHGMVRHLRLGSRALAERCIETAQTKLSKPPANAATR